MRDEDRALLTPDGKVDYQQQDDDGRAATEAPAPSGPWPKLTEEAFHGLAGEIARTIEPHTEADVASILIQTLVMFGSMVGRRPHARVESDRHGCNLFINIVGRTSRSRKGVSYNRARAVAREADPDWAEHRIISGLSTGEGLIHGVRDPMEKTEAVREKGRPTGEYATVVVDQGVADKRLLIYEAEFARTIAVAGRNNSILTAVLRDAWDGRTLAALTKESAERATDPHISFIGNITTEELHRRFDSIEMANGYGNRFLWVRARRSQELPDGGSLDQEVVRGLGRRMRAAVEYARGVDEVTRDAAASAIWHEVYGDLTREVPGLTGGLTARAESQVLRLSVIYALMDSSFVIRPEHLTAALAVWAYAEESVNGIWGDALGDPIADTILAALRVTPAGLTRTDISNLLGRNQDASRIEKALTSLFNAKRARGESERGTGRPTERWFAC